MTWNILHKGWEKEGHASWRERAGGIVEILREHQPDVVGLQEDSKTQVDLLVNALSGYSYLDRHAKKGGGLLIRNEAWHVIESGKIAIPGGRRASWALLESRRNGARWLFYNAHLIHRTAPDSAAQRLEGARNITQHLLNRSSQDVPVVFTGDFNALPDMPVMRYLGGDAGSPVQFANAFTLVHGDDDPRATWRGLGKAHHGERIDHILVNAHVSVLDAEIIFYDDLSDPYPSDHYPLQTTLRATRQQDIQEQHDRGSPVTQ